MIRLLAALYVAGCLTYIGTYLIRKTDKFFWKGVGTGMLISLGYILFILAVMEVVHPMSWQ